MSKSNLLFSDKVRLPKSVEMELQAEKYQGITCSCCKQINHTGASGDRLVEVINDDNGFWQSKTLV